jgi:hypothetical protein
MNSLCRCMLRNVQDGQSILRKYYGKLRVQCVLYGIGAYTGRRTIQAISTRTMVEEIPRVCVVGCHFEEPVIYPAMQHRGLHADGMKWPDDFVNVKHRSERLLESLPCSELLAKYDRNVYPVASYPTSCRQR